MNILIIVDSHYACNNVFDSHLLVNIGSKIYENNLIILTQNSNPNYHQIENITPYNYKNFTKNICSKTNKNIGFTRILERFSNIFQTKTLAYKLLSEYWPEYKNEIELLNSDNKQEHTIGINQKKYFNAYNLKSLDLTGSLIGNRCFGLK